MSNTLEAARQTANATRYQPGQPTGHYESFFLRANHPTRPLAFWIRYTIFSPREHPEQAQGELWAIAFDGETDRHTAVKSELPFTDCAFDRARFSVRVGDARLEPGTLTGAAATGDQRIAWDLTYTGSEPPLFLLPLAAYDGPRPKAKSLVGLPLAAFSGSLDVNGERIVIENWVGSQNHNWGPQHTDYYAWGQVAGFDSAPDTFLEAVTVRQRIGPFWGPFITLLVLRHHGQEYALNAIGLRRQTTGSFTPFTWHFRGETDAIRIEGQIEAPSAAFVGLTYRNPPGGTKICMNSKIASCALTLTHKTPQGWAAPTQLTASHRAAFEILSDTADPRVAVRA